MLKSIEISGFKSFGKRAKLDFKTPISAIVGPNGSGKSNVAEAFRFALGEQSMKSLRGKRTEDLIFNGSAQGNRSNRASVRVILDNSTKPLGIDFDEVVLERVIHRDATHEYKINDSKVRRKDIVELLANANIGSTGHHIISQGESDRILNVSPEERREMIEDALGLKIYHYKKKESLRKLKRTEQNLKEVESLRKEIKPHLKFLKKQVGKVEKAKEQRDELVSLYKEYFAYEDGYIKKHTGEVDGLLTVPRGELKKIDLEIKRLQSVLDGVKKESEFSKDLSRKDRELKEIQGKRSALTRDLGRVEGELDAAERTVKRYSNFDSHTVPYSRIEELSIYIEKIASDGDKSEDLSFIKKSLKNISDKITGFVKEFSKKEVDTTEDDLGLLREKKEAIQNEIKRLDEKKTELLGEQADLQHKSDEERKSFYAAERDLFKVLARQNELRAKLEKLEDQKREIDRRKEEYEKELTHAGMIFGREAVNYANESVGTDESEQRDRYKKIERLKIKLEDSGIGSYGELKKEYDEITERDSFFEKEISDLTSTRQSLEGMIKEIDKTLDERFKGGLNNINNQFQEFFSLMFGGGEASLSIVRPKFKKSEEGYEDEEGIKEGIEINVDLPKKKIRGLQMLSGGERALTSIALLFALSQINPPPFIILDETDAALDEANSKRYGDMIENLAKYSQLILITHNRETMSRAGLLYGVTMRDDGISRLLSIEFDEAVRVAK